jgi:hypothetical protein
MRTFALLFIGLICGLCHGADDQSKELNALVRWAKEYGAVVDSVSIVTQADGQRGLVATKAMKKGSTAVSIPTSLAMCPQNFVKTDLGKALLADEKVANSVTLTETGLLIVLLVSESSKKDSFWAPYIATLPKDLGTAVAVTFEEEDFALFNGTLSKGYLKDAAQVLAESVKQQEQFFKTHSELVKKFYPDIDVSKAKLQWAVAMVHSRQLVVASGERRDTAAGELPQNAHACLAPVIDMMNHRPSAQVADVDEAGLFSQELSRDVAKGEEVFTNYGAMPMELSFTNYGFSTAEMAVNLGPHFRQLMERNLEEKELMVHGQAHTENVARQLVAKRCHGMDSASHGGVIGWRLLKRLLQCTRILSCGPVGLETLVRREPEEEGISNRPFDFPAEVKALETWIDILQDSKHMDEEWRMSGIAKQPLESLTPKQLFIVKLRNAEKLFIAGHLKELQRMYDASAELSDALDKDKERWDVIQEEKNKFRLTDDISAKEKEREEEEKRVNDALEGSFDGSSMANSIGGSGSEYDEF